MSKMRLIASRPALHLVLLLVCTLTLAWPLTHAVRDWSWLTVFYYWFGGWGLVVVILLVLSRYVTFVPRSEASSRPDKPEMGQEDHKG